MKKNVNINKVPREREKVFINVEKEKKKSIILMNTQSLEISNKKKLYKPLLFFFPSLIETIPFLQRIHEIL